MNTFLINILVHALGSAPAVIDDLKAGFQENWNLPHVQQAMQGIQVLTKLAEDLTGMGQQDSARQVAPAVVAPAPTPAPVAVVPTPQPAPGPVI